MDFIQELLVKYFSSPRPTLRLRVRDVMIVAYRWGLIDYKHTLQETADKFGMSRERVRQIEKKTFEKIKKVDKEKVGKRLDK